MTNKTLSERVAEVLALAETATPGPWHVELGGFIYSKRRKVADCGVGSEQTSYFIAAAPSMAQVIREQQAEIARLSQIERDFNILKPDPGCDAGCMLVCNMEAHGLLREQQGVIDCLRNELLDALDLKAGNGPTALAMVAAERDRLRAECEALRAKVPDIDAMVYRFLGWKLPADFYPDCWVSFNREKASVPPYSWPIGTNLLTAPQARQMIEHMLGIDAARAQEAGDGN